MPRRLVYYVAFTVVGFVARETSSLLSPRIQHNLVTLGVNRAGDLATLHGNWLVRRVGALTSKQAAKIETRKPHGCNRMARGYA